MRLVLALFAPTAVNFVWMLVLDYHGQQELADKAAVLSIGLGVATVLSMLDELWRDIQRERFVEVHDRLQTWRTQPLDWHGSEGIRQNTRGQQEIQR